MAINAQNFLMKIKVCYVICCNGVPVGHRLSRNTPMPSYQTSYELTPEGREEAERDKERIEKYVTDYEQNRGFTKKRR